MLSPKPPKILQDKKIPVARQNDFCRNNFRAIHVARSAQLKTFICPTDLLTHLRTRKDIFAIIYRTFWWSPFVTLAWKSIMPRLYLHIFQVINASLTIIGLRKVIT